MKKSKLTKVHIDLTRFIGINLKINNMKKIMMNE